MPEAPPALTVDVRPDRDRAFVVVRGELDHFTVDAVRTAVRELVSDDWRHVVLDLSELAFMDSAGVHLLEELRDGRLGPAECSMIDGRRSVSLPLQLLGLDRPLPLARSGE